MVIGAAETQRCRKEAVLTRLSATIQSSSVGRAVVGRAGRLVAKRMPIPRMQAVEFQGRGAGPAQYEKVLAGGYVSGEWSLLGTRFGVAGGERHLGRVGAAMHCRRVAESSS
jgi:hypothetical protein